MKKQNHNTLIETEFFTKDFTWIKEIKIVTDCLPKPWRFVGGCVRDSLLGINTTDIDITILSDPNTVEKCLQKFTITTIGKKFGTIGVFFRKWSIEITTTRRDIETDGRHANVCFQQVDFAEDSKRRDFTINTIMMDENKIFYDYHNGIQDLKNGIVKFVGIPEHRIEEDYLRILRYIRFFVRFGKKQNLSLELIQKYAYKITTLSKERIIKEMESMCKHKNTHYAFALMNESHINKYFWKNNLFIDINDSLNAYEKFAYALWPFYNLKQNFPLNKNVKYLLGLKMPLINDVYFHLAYLWNKYKNTDCIKDYLKIHKFFYKENITIYSYELNTEYFNQFEGVQRGQVELLAKYYTLQGIKYNYESLKKNANILNEIKIKYKNL